MEHNLTEEYCENKGKEIAKKLTDTYDSADFETDTGEIEKEIYGIALSCAKIFFFETKSLLPEEDRENAKSLVRSRFDIKEKEVEKMSDTDLVAHYIKLEVIEALKEMDILLS